MINEYYAKKFCCEDIGLIENYELAIADTTQTWHCHHRGEVLPCGRFSPNDLKKFGLYYKRPAPELIFLTKAEHNRLHKSGVPLSEEHKKAISDSKKGVPKSEATKKAMSEARKDVPLSEEHKKALSDSLKGVPLSEDHKKAISDGLKGHSVSEATKKAIGEALSKKILQFTKSGEFIREWPSLSEAMRQTGIRNICRCCRGITKSAGGYIWRYAEYA